MASKASGDADIGRNDYVIASPSGHPADLFGTAVDGVWRSHLVLGFVLRSLMCLLFCAFVMMCELACFVVSIAFRHVVPISLYFLFFLSFAHFFVSRWSGVILSGHKARGDEKRRRRITRVRRRGRLMDKEDHAR